MAPLIKATNLFHLGDEKRLQVWEIIRGGTDVRVKLRDVVPVPIIGGWSVSLHGIVVALFGDDPNPSGLT